MTTTPTPGPRGRLAPQDFRGAGVPGHQRADGRGGVGVAMPGQADGNFGDGQPDNPGPAELARARGGDDTVALEQHVDNPGQTPMKA